MEKREFAGDISTCPVFRHTVAFLTSNDNARVVEVLAVMAKYNPFFEKAGMVRVDYQRDEISVSKKIRSFLEAHSFDFTLARSASYCRSFFSNLSNPNKEALVGYLSEFGSQPFVKMGMASPDLLTRLFSSEGVYLYWVNASLLSLLKQ